MSQFCSRRAVAAVALSTAAVLVPSLASAQPVDRAVAQPKAPPADAAVAGAAATDWLRGELWRGRIPSVFPGYIDWGLTVDAAFALAADGRRPAQLRAVGQVIENNYFTKYATFNGTISANAMSKTLVLTKVLRQRAWDFGGHNVRRLVLNRVQGPTAGFESGRLRDKGASDFSNTFGQAFGVIGLARSGGLPQSTVGYLLKQRCSEGYFRLAMVEGESCNTSDSPADVDATAVAIQALVAARRAGAAVPQSRLRGSVDWLVSVQRPNGSFGGGVQTGGSNANSSGLAAMALRATGRYVALADVRNYVKSLQLTRPRVGTGPALDEIGALAYNRAQRQDAVAAGIPDADADRDQFRRATAQGYFALVTRPFHILTAP